MKKVTIVLLLYAILVIASSVFWVWSAVSKSRLTEGINTSSFSPSSGAHKTKEVTETATEHDTELTGGDADRVKAGGQANNNVKSTVILSEKPEQHEHPQASTTHS